MQNLIHKFTNSEFEIKFARFALILVLFLFGNYKWFEFEVELLKPIISATWLNFLYAIFGFHGASYFLGVIESIGYIALAIGYKKPKAGILGALIVILTGLVTLSLMPQLGKPDGFILKDIFMVALGFIILKYDLTRIQKARNQASFI
ncbi:YkgB family protein [Campylobacter sp. RM16187]|uniref:YkgB family protein n=1 Tax=Campylobacter sp. RM16187 TaxID=1660063 RepID=UPI0021B5CC52|nr:YkgB family protein [Campylobacter sp. RM16187]QKG28376.1 hypothetical membrane protein (DUF417 domain) [Campylobacter sp. RM16187]